MPSDDVERKAFLIGPVYPYADEQGEQEIGQELDGPHRGHDYGRVVCQRIQDERQSQFIHFSADG